MVDSNAAHPNGNPPGVISQIVAESTAYAGVPITGGN
jgi:hypothetical protein